MAADSRRPSPEFNDYYRRIAGSGFATRRVRVVQEPLTPYLQWELHVLRLRHEYGGLTQVVGPGGVAAVEVDGPLPEIYTLGTDVMYEAIYDAAGVLEAARRWRNPRVVARCQESSSPCTSTVSRWTSTLRERWRRWSLRARTES